jgi:signal transduction histidine kinase
LKRIIFIIWAYVSLSFPMAQAMDNQLTIDSNSKYFDPVFHVSYLSDPHNMLGIEDILHEDFSGTFIHNDDEILHFGFVEFTYWIKFQVQNYNQFTPYLEIENPALDTIHYFLVNNEGRLVHQELTGNAVKTADRPIKTSRLLINMQLSDNEIYTCYLRVNSQSTSIAVPMRIASLEKYFESINSESIWQGIYFGLIIFLFIYNLFLFLSIKDTSYLYFAIFIGFSGFVFSFYSGFCKELLWDILPKRVQWLAIFVAAGNTFMILFSSRFLHSKVKTPKLHNWLVALIIMNVALILIDLIGYGALALKLMLYNTIMGLFFLMFLAVKSWTSGFKPAKYYMLAWSFHVVGVIVSLLADAMLIKVNMNIAEILQLSSTLSIFLMSFALSKKINIYIEGRNRAQEMALRTALENEQLIISQNHQLEARVHQRTIDLEQSISTLSRQRQDLHDANNFKDKIFSIISHDLKSPITSLAGLLQIMKMKSLNEEERSKAIDSLEIALKGTKNLLDNILAWANTKPAKHEENDEIELKQLVNDIFQLFLFQASNKNIELKNLIETDFHILSNRNMLQLVLRNLVSNALKFTPKNGYIEVGMRQDFLNVEIFVKDTGIGMNEEIQENLFKSNRHNTTRGTENEKGTGLGLKLCKEFLDKYNGNIHVHSVLKKGTTITISLKNAIPVLETVVN